jgi:RND family efflux transporter MFP subunit
MKPIFLIFLACISLIFTGCGRDDTADSDGQAPVRPVRYIQMTPATQVLNPTFSGTAVADRQAVLSFKVAGTVNTIPVKVGERVTAGTLLAHLDETDLQIDLESARSGLKSAEADAKSAQASVYTTRSNYDRIQKLYENDSVSLSEFEQARGNYDTARAQLQAAESKTATQKSKLAAAGNQLRYTRLTAPFDGIVNSIMVQENEEVTPGAPILTLNSLGKLEIQVDVSDLYIAGIKAEMPCRIFFPALDHESFPGRVTEVSYGSADTPTYPVTVSVLSEDARLRPGMAAEVRFDFSENLEQTGLYVPPDGLGEDPDGPFVFVIEQITGDHGIIRKRAINIGPLTNEGFLVTNGLSPGDRVVTAGLHLLMDGMAVRLLDDPVNQW